MSGNDYNFGVDGYSLSHYTQTIYLNNTVDGKPIYYWVDQQGRQIPTDAGYVGVVNSTNIIVRDLNLIKNLQGILFMNTSNSIIENVTANSNNDGILLDSSTNNRLTNNTANSNTQHGILLDSSTNNRLTNNTANSNTQHGILLDSSSNNRLTDNTANSNTQHGIYLYSSSNNNTLMNSTAYSNNRGIFLSSSSNNNTLTNNTGYLNDYGIYLSSLSNNNTLTNNTGYLNDYGIYLSSLSNNNTLTNNTGYLNNYSIYLYLSSNNTFTNNTAYSNTRGIYLYLSSNNTLTSNTAYLNDYGINMSSSSNNQIYNNYFNNSNNAYDNRNNTWNTTPTPGTNIIGGPWLGGNYWSDYSGNDTNGDGLGDNLTPYNSSGMIVNGGDYYPLVDTSPPTLTIFSPLEGQSYNTSTVSLNVTADETIVTWLYNINGTANVNVTFTPNTTLPSLPDGIHNVTVYANNSQGKIGSALVNFNIDTTDPVIHNLSLSDTSPGYGQQIVVYVNVTDINLASVTAGSTSLTHQSGALWNGTITAGYGTNTVTVTAYDNASNRATNSSLSYTGPGQPRSGGSSGGSSGGGVGHSDEPENVEETIFLRIYLVSGVSSTYDFNSVVTSVEVTPKKTYGLVGAKMEILVGRPGRITTDHPGGVLFKYINIFVGTSGWSEDKLSRSVINFKVPASWFEENNIDPASVTLYRHHDGEWQPLATTLTGQAGGYYQYSSPTPGFSTFMILGQVKETGAGKPVDAPDSGTVTEPTSTPEETTTNGTPGFGVLLGIMGVLMAVYSRKR